MDNKRIGMNISIYRKAKKLTQKQLAAAINRTESSIQKYEKGEVEAPLSVIEKIAAVLDIPVRYLLDFEEQNFINQVIGGIEPAFEKMLSDMGYKLVYGPENLDKITIIGDDEESITIGINEMNELSRSTQAYINFRLHELFSRK